MYWCKIARTKAEFDDIARLNYETFVEEIPQHQPDASGRRTDPFHEQNTYLIVLSGVELVGMIALRSERPFSLDLKIGNVENFLPDMGKVCEIRLLAVRKAHRNGRVFFLLASALSDFCLEQGFESAVISGTTRQLKLYAQLGFGAFADAVGTGEAVFIPMVTTRRQYLDSAAARLQSKRRQFVPGPVALAAEISAPFQKMPFSHRSAAFYGVRQEVDRMLFEMTGASSHLLSGSGTLANEAMLAQLTELGTKGLILVNGEFGRRLARQAERLNLNYEVTENPWGQAFDFEKIKEQLATGDYGWLLMVHGETSTGQLNDFFAITDVCKQWDIKLCIDCISSFGAVPFSLENVWLATATSGKAIGTMSGIAIVFAHHKITPNQGLPSYLDLGLYSANIPFTFPSSLLESFECALAAYPERYELLNRRFRQLQKETEDWPVLSAGYPTSRTFKVTDDTRFLVQDAHLSGFELHSASAYLKTRGLFQISCIQPEFEKDWQQFLEFYSYYERYHATAKARH
ncbi:aminotransferase class V-fold PLP-dependent enzyme [Planococcus sp. CPCC 101016]|uniref:GNAT family N-acetyltransferase n=1 Tax=Planococcus sp. CPCC 101016 TaxID=2599617 RepID=UPI0011B5DAF0|nr:GNAT family N-acetyltransferase [Planococcus sp. CPCC 101016]TWT04145.1 aminotransferase class V-fold PLP-dependent enzyme [Planococcus sp. CPCC 101016]